MALEPFETAQAETYPTVTQLSVFLVDRVGQLLRLTKAFEPTDIHILALSVVNAVDCAVVRMIVDDPEEASDILRRDGFAISESELIVVSLPRGKRGLLRTWVALLGAEVSIAYTYPLLVQPQGRPALAVQADNLDHAADTLVHKNFTVLGQSDLLDRA